MTPEERAQQEYPPCEEHDEQIENPCSRNVTAHRLRAAYLKGYAAGQQDRWIPVSERLPEGYQWVLVYSDTGDIGDFPFDIGRIISREWKCLGWDYPVTHWTPLPTPPQP